MVANGFDEIVTYSFMNPDEFDKLGTDPKHVALLNPLSMDMAVMRPSLVYNLLAAASYNYRRQNRDINSSEIASVSIRKESRGNNGTGFCCYREENPLDYSEQKNT